MNILTYFNNRKAILLRWPFYCCKVSNDVLKGNNLLTAETASCFTGYYSDAFS